MIDYEYFRNVFPNEPNLIKDLVKITISEYPDFINNFKYCLKNNDLKQLKKLAHKWQYTASIFGAQALRSNLEQLENYAQIDNSLVYKLGQTSIRQLESVYEELNQINTSRTVQYQNH